jgi:PmbA protein
MDDLLDIAQHAVRAATGAGAEWADAYCGRLRHADVGMDNSSILDCHIVRDHGLGIRAFYHGGMGFATVQDLSPAAVTQCGEDAARMARAAHPDPDFVRLPEPSDAPPIAGLFCDEVAGLPAERVVEWCCQAIAEAREVTGEARVSGGAGFTVGEGALASSTGIALARPGTKIDLSVEVTIQRDDEVGFYFDFDVARRLDDFAPAGLGASAAREALRFLGARPVTTGLMDLVLGPLTAGQFLGAIIGAANAESIQRRRSFLQDRAGTAIGPECLTIRELPFWPAGLNSSSHDGEGVAKQEMALLDRGVLTAYLHNSYTAQKAQAPNNAHGTRGGYTGAVGIGLSNLQILPGDRPAAELVAEVQDGLYISYAGLAPDATSGEVSATVDFGFRILKGEVCYPVKMAMVGGNAFTMLGSLDAVSSDYREEPGSITPSLRLRGIQVAGAG